MWNTPGRYIALPLALVLALASVVPLGGRTAGPATAGALPSAFERILAVAESTGTVQLKLVPQEATIGVNGTVNVAIIVEAGTQAVDGVEVALAYDTQYLNVDDGDTGRSGINLAPGNCNLPTTLKSEADNTTGVLHLGTGADLTDPQPITGTCTLGIIIFRGVQETPTAGTVVSFTLPPTFPGTKATLAGSTLTIGTVDGVLHVAPCNLSLDPHRGPVETGTTVFGQRCVTQAGQTVELRWDSVDGILLGTAAVDLSGDFTQTVSLPDTATAGEHPIIVVAGGEERARAVFTVTVLLDLLPEFAGVGVGGTVDVSIHLSSATQQVDGVEAVLSFDPTYLEVVDTDAGRSGVNLTVGDCALSTLLTNTADNTAGTIHLSRGVDLTDPQPISGDCTVGIIRFQGKAVTPDNGETPVPVNFVLPAAFPSTKVSFDGNALPLTARNGGVKVVPQCLTFTSQPVAAAHGFSFGLQPVVEVQNPCGTKDSDNSSTVVTLRIMEDTGTPGALLACTGGTSKAASGGVVAFSGCKIDLKGDGYILEAVAASFRGSATAAFPVTWAGDANDNDQVDILDFSILVKNFGKRDGDTGYDSRADMSGDKLVDIVDFSMLATMFGTRRPSVTLAPASGGAGTVVTVTGTAYVANRQITVTLDDTVTLTTAPATVTTDASGNFTATFTVPAGLGAGPHSVKASQNSGRIIAAATLTVP